MLSRLSLLPPLRPNWFVPSPDGKLVAVSLSKVGSEAGDLHLYDAANGKQVHEVVPGCKRHGRRQPGLVARLQGLLLHPLSARQGASARGHGLLPAAFLPRTGRATAKDRYELGKDLPRIAEIKVQMHDATRKAALHRAERRRRRVRPLPPRSRRQMAEVHRVQGPDRPGRLCRDGNLFLVSRTRRSPRGKVLAWP